MFGFSTSVGNITILQDIAQSCGKKIDLLEETALDSPINLSLKMKFELYEVTCL